MLAKLRHFNLLMSWYACHVYVTFCNCSCVLVIKNVKIPTKGTERQKCNRWLYESEITRVRC